MKRRQVAAWALYDFANSAFPAVITSTLFSVYFAQAVVGNETGRGDLWWGRAMSLSVLFVAVSSPLLGSLADRAGLRKKLLFAYTYVCIACTALFVSVEPGMVLWGFALVVLANVGFEGALVYYNAYLPELAPPGRQGALSGLGFGVGYAGSLAGLLIALPLVARERLDLVWVSVSLFFALFSLPAMFWLPPDRARQRAAVPAALEELRGFRRVVGEVLRERELRRFLLAFFFYIDGVLTVIVFASIFAAQTLGFSSEELLYMFLVVQVSALAGALGLARATDVHGPKRVITLALLSWTGIVVSAYFIESKALFFALAVMAGTGLGVVQAASRSLMAGLIPAGKEAEMFGFYAFCGKSSAVLGPLVFGAISAALGGNQRVAVLAVAAFLLSGLVLLQRVGEPGAGRT